MHTLIAIPIILVLSLSSLFMGGCGLLGPPRAVVEPSGVEIQRNLSVGIRADRPLGLDVYRAQGATEIQPVALWIHGGGWLMGSKDTCPIARLALRGYTVISLEYRLSREGHWPHQENDLRYAVDWIREHAQDLRIDPDRMVAWGASAGGHLALRLGQGDNPPVAAVVAWFPATDLVRLYDESEDWRMRLAIRRLVGGSPRVDQRAFERARDASVALYDIQVPVLILHGSEDQFIPIEHSRQLVDFHRSRGGMAELVTLQGYGHGNWAMAKREARLAAHAFQDPLMRPLLPFNAPD